MRKKAKEIRGNPRPGRRRDCRKGNLVDFEGQKE